MSQNAYSRIETGRTRLDLDLLYKFADYYHITISDLLENPPVLPTVPESSSPSNDLEHTQMINALCEQLEVKDRQIDQLLNLLRKSG